MSTLVKNNFGVKGFAPRTYSDLLDNFLTESVFNSKISKFWTSADIAEDDKGYYISIALPGLKKEDIKIDLNEGIISVSGEKKFNKEENGKKYHAVENQYGAFQRSFRLPDNIDAQAIEAEYVDGILNLNVPKDEKKVVKSTIQIK